jgi:hypothetical protein
VSSGVVHDCFSVEHISEGTGKLPEDRNVMPKHVGAYLLTYLLHVAESFLRS